MRHPSLLVFLPLLCLLTGAVSAQVTSTELIEKAADFDGREVEFRGEAIGDPMRRGDHAWINVNDGGNAVGVWADATAAAAVRLYGSYRVRGDTILVRGVFHRSCPEHGGDLDIHASEITFLLPGGSVAHPVKVLSLVVSALLLGVAFILDLLWKGRERVLGRS
jgi:hypothetical protein